MRSETNGGTRFSRPKKKKKHSQNKEGNLQKPVPSQYEAVIDMMDSSSFTGIDGGLETDIFVSVPHMYLQLSNVRGYVSFFAVLKYGTRECLDDSTKRRFNDNSKEHAFKFEEGRITKKAVWEIIAIKFKATNSKEYQSVTWVQLKSKWQKLETKFKQIDDKNRKSGEGTYSFKHMEEMKEAVGDNPNISLPKNISS
ncbi:unnamed protein product [Mytilus coruscus]|uniref:Myb/SANT-like DNA-binding domain-containing protein n=1 Tax=Mytilus coruscus TaxID=42192 RepID=A0A6J8E3I9_MYTCO|nr:unnamed protein product [Mytilus coruscus]